MTISRTICLGFLALLAIGTILLTLPFSTSDGTWSDPVTALFTTTSCVCVTGLSVVDVGKFYSFWGQLIMVCLVQVGGLGYMTATTVLILLVGRKLGLRDKLAVQQSLDQPGLAGAGDLVRSIIAMIVIIEITGIFLLLPAFVPDFGFSQGLWLSIFHSVNAFNNAGFSLFSNNLINYVNSPLVNFVISSLIILGGIGYQVIMEVFLWVRDRLSKNQTCIVFSLNFKVVTSTTLFLLIVGTIGFFLTEFNNPGTFAPLSFGNKIMAAWFQSVVPRTAGFNTVDYGKMTNAGLWLTIALMFMGASPGSTGGGIKTTTVRILFNCTKAVLQGKEEVLAYQRQIPPALILKAVAVQVGSMLVVIIATVLIALFDKNIGFIDILLEVVSAFATVGLSTGITAKLSLFPELVIITTMYIGRVGILLLMSAILGDPKPSAIRYPEENLLVG
ncbi:TrkH family potassium uptake protein [Microcoleus sp. FACHB-68]|uniref:TrkH family potassium uptake protein n=1 Tax=Microcoleus sp. FACHB-68 TaxID=2692826 RepID=UPI0016876CD4|nr:TrkH family potassium uptake protein [Microcoleus sp. FACHB-68]MBD1937859.1 ATPase [Microcoleus sp. FACHB-68]